MEQGERGSDAKSDAETEEEEGDHALLTASPWGTQESGKKGPRGDARAGGINSFRWFGKTKCTAAKAVDEEGAGPGIFYQAG